MKNLYYLLLVAIMVYGCYDDKGNYNYTELAELEVSLPEESHSILFGDRLQITPTIETSIPQSDLAYDWEFLSDTLNTLRSWEEYVSVYKERALDYVCEKSKVLSGEKTYNLRLNVTQVSTGRHFYSNVVGVKLSGMPSQLGAMVFHGNGTSSDIGMIVAAEFQISKPSDSFTDQILPHYYSDVNGAKIDGKGKSILQTYFSRTALDPEFIRVIALTDKGAAWIESKSFERVGDWNDLFFGGLNKGIPQGWFLNSYEFFIWDGGYMFRRQSNAIQFVAPILEAGGAPTYDLKPQIYITPASRLYAALFFDNKSRGFVGTRSAGANPVVVTPFDVVAPTVPFNPADLDADLICLDAGGPVNHMVAVMKKDNGDHFMIEMDMNATSAVDAPKYKYDLSHLPDVQSGKVFHWDFSPSYINMGFYATSTGVYQFAIDAGNQIKPEQLRMTNNEVVAFDGTVTMMKILKTKLGFSPAYYMRNIEMVVGTYGGSAGTGKLHSIELNPLTGRALSVKTYSGFDEIYDVDIKGW